MSNCEICDKPLTGRQKRCCSKECKTIWFGKSRKKENPVWTPEYEKEYQKQYRKNTTEKRRAYNRAWREQNRDKCIEDKRIERQRLKTEVLSRYSNGEIICKNCGFKDERALQLDHIFNNGAEERREIFGDRTCAGTTFYRWIRQQNYPDGYQVLCANCNIIKLREWQQK